ncbi:hypothetical protein I317_04437 [Kwoniella heveanensis CBS 569]|uniref:Uncharacterized protein n=1 Tax=Kwoniella heveanensis BCC8398 TaxID=1296120 RepID=A0A1B9GVB6_9TREE|nr:hypothetical protein I316_03528 [Kwoniella heveanensis BCC8398]OCF41733.1 hypothetical protein I317_04437 [Kwoniella heveanensis CBS 569]
MSLSSDPGQSDIVSSSFQPPPYTTLDHSSSSPPSSAASSTNQYIPLLPLGDSTISSPSHHPHQTLDKQSQRVLDRALRDFQRQQTPSEWGRYRHGHLISPGSSYLADEAPPGIVIRGLIWLVELMAPPEDLMSSVAWREGAGMLAGANHF